MRACPYLDAPDDAAERKPDRLSEKVMHGGADIVCGSTIPRCVFIDLAASRIAKASARFRWTGYRYMSIARKRALRIVLSFVANSAWRGARSASALPGTEAGKRRGGDLPVNENHRPVPRGDLAVPMSTLEWLTIRSRRMELNDADCVT